jgi:chromosome segregation ATPase
LLQARQEHFGRLLEQSLIQRQMTSEQLAMVQHGEVEKWKETAKNYEEKYGQLKENYEYVSEKANSLEKQLNLIEEEKEG